LDRPPGPASGGSGDQENPGRRGAGYRDDSRPPDTAQANGGDNGPVSRATSGAGAPARRGGPAGRSARPRPSAPRSAEVVAGPLAADEPDPQNDADADAALTGVELIRRELGGQIIDEIDNP
jgi:DNA polymerase-3 subunit gamma/tau